MEIMKPSANPEAFCSIPLPISHFNKGPVVNIPLQIHSFLQHSNKQASDKIVSLQIVPIFYRTSRIITDELREVTVPESRMSLIPA